MTCTVLGYPMPTLHKRSIHSIKERKTPSFPATKELGHSCNSLIPSFPSKISTGRSKDMSSTALHDGINIRPWNPWKHVPYALNPHAPPHAPQKNENFDASTDMKVLMVLFKCVRIPYWIVSRVARFAPGKVESHALPAHEGV